MIRQLVTFKAARILSIGGMCAALVLNCAWAAAENPTIKLLKLAGNGGQVIEVQGLASPDLVAFEKLSPEGQRDVLQVRVVSDLEDPPALAGRAEVVESTLRFTPRYPLTPGLSYRVAFHGGVLQTPAKNAETVTVVLKVPPTKRQPATTQVSAIYPTAAQLPENQLKFYLHFSAPMRPGNVYRHIHLLDAAGKEVEGAFLELDEELWDRDQRRFTLLLDPGRVKRGLRPREELGPVLVAGRDFSLRVDTDWLDAEGRPLAAPGVKKFHVGAVDETPVDPARWKLQLPAAGTREPLTVAFGEPLDRALVERVIRVVSASEHRLPGKVTIGEHETGWQFKPDAPWTAGKYQVLSDTTLEDLSGNAIGRAFEVDEFEPIANRIDTHTVAVPFEVK